MAVRLQAWTAIAAAGLALAACATEQQSVQSREQMLSAAGFTMRPANTPDREREMANLPPLQVTYQPRNGSLVYLFPDPAYCRCLFIGSESAYQQYQRLAFEQRVAREQLAAAQLSANSWDWGPWGPGWW
jgi:hypothetical protein